VKSCGGLSPRAATQDMESLNFLKAPKAYADPRSGAGERR